MAYCAATANNFSLKLTVTQKSQNVSLNKSTVNWTLEFGPTGWSSYNNFNYISEINGKTGISGQYFRAVINGTEVLKNVIDWGTMVGGSSKTIASGSLDIPHNSDGAKSFSFSCKFWRETTNNGQDYPYYPRNMESSGSISLTTIPRKSSITWPSVSNDTYILGNTYSGTITASSSSFRHILWCNINGISLDGKINSSQGYVAVGKVNGTALVGSGSIDFKIPTEYGPYLNLATDYPATLSMDTYTGSFTNISDRSGNLGNVRKSVTVHIPDSWVPTCTIDSVSNIHGSTDSDLSGSYIQNVSKVKVVVEASGSNGSVILSVSCTIDGRSYTGTEVDGKYVFQSDILTTSGTKTISVTAMDSRGRTATATETISVVEYSRPYISTFKAYRCDSSGESQDDGTYIKFEWVYSATSISGGTNAYSFTIKSTGSLSPLYSSTSRTGSSSTIVSPYSESQSFIFVAALEDSYFKTSRQVTVGPSFALVNFGANGRSICFGGQSSDVGTVESKLPLVVKDSIFWNQQLQGNRLMGADATGISAHYSKNSGSSWTGYYSPKPTLEKLINTETAYTIGKNTSTTTTLTNYRTRFIFNATTMGIQASIDKLLVKAAANGSTGCWVTIDGAYVGSSNFTVNIATQMPIETGISVCAFDEFIFGSESGNIEQVRLIFGCTRHPSTVGDIGLTINHIGMYGKEFTTLASPIAETGIPYSVNKDLGVDIPYTVSATQLKFPANTNGSTSETYSVKGLGSKMIMAIGTLVTTTNSTGWAYPFTNSWMNTLLGVDDASNLNTVMLMTNGDSGVTTNNFSQIYYAPDSAWGVYSGRNNASIRINFAIIYSG